MAVTAMVKYELCVNDRLADEIELGRTCSKVNEIYCLVTASVGQLACVYWSAWTNTNWAECLSHIWTSTNWGGCLSQHGLALTGVGVLVSMD